MADRKKVAFIMLYNILEGGGNENWLLNLLSDTNFASKYDITVYQPDLYLTKRLDEETVDRILKTVNVVTYHDYIHKIDFLNSNKITRLFSESLLKPIFLRVLSATLMRKVSRNISSNDVVYLFSNEYQGLIRKGPQLVIGTTHNWSPGWTNIFGKIRLKLIEDGIIMSKIDAFNFFSISSQRKMDCKRFRTEIIPICRNSKSFIPRDSDKNAIIFTFVGRLVQCKGVMEVLSAWKRSGIGQYAELHIVGSGPMLREITANEEINIFVHGSVATDELKRILSISDYFLFPTKCDVFPNVVIEAAMSGNYVFCSKFLEGEFDDLREKNILEYIEPSEDGVAIALAKAMKRGKISQSEKMYFHSYVASNYDISILDRKLTAFIESNTISTR